MLKVCLLNNMVEHKCDKCNYLAADKVALAQHLQRKTPCDEGKYLCSAQMSMQADASNQQMATASNASTLAAKAVFDIMSQPHKEYDANQLVLHQPVGSENTSHLKGSSLSTWSPAARGPKHCIDMPERGLAVLQL